MNEQTKKKTLAEALAEKNKISFGSPEHIRLVEAGYGMTVEKAETIIAERPKNPQLWPYELYEKAQALIAQLEAKPIAIDPEPGWHREHYS